MKDRQIITISEMPIMMMRKGDGESIHIAGSADLNKQNTYVLCAQVHHARP